MCSLGFPTSWLGRAWPGLCRLGEVTDLAAPKGRSAMCWLVLVMLKHPIGTAVSFSEQLTGPFLLQPL
ncbi:hypothetical protein JZ751_020835 [Albula glossodonta]|uniref:Uncharacterized protein n=1 Tax=Albula glossodonta TaxID=121402 RepID=A0A8T2PLR5_9TELE|nr:hypothetical protein JZ751_020835 [Albula glossodonta]